MLTHHPEIEQKAFDRRGQVWMSCDAEGCNAEVQVGDPVIPAECPQCGAATTGGQFCSQCGFKFLAEVPKGWRTSDPFGDPLAGAAQMCKKHADLIVLPPDDAPAPVVEATPSE